MIEFRDIPGFPGYRVGSDGSVWSRRNNRWGLSDTWRQLRPQPNNKYGRLVVHLGDNSGPQYVHHLVLNAFVGPRPDGSETLHKNGNAGDNSIGNLRWGTREENISDFCTHGRKKGEGHPLAKLTSAKVLRIRARAAVGETHQAIADSLSIRRETVSKIVRYERWIHI